MKRKFGIFGLTWLLGPEGPPDEETRMNLCSVVLLFGRGRRLRENGVGGGNIDSLLLRVCGLFEGIVVGSDLILVLIPRTGRRLLGGRSEASIDVKTRQLVRNKTTRCTNSARKAYDALISNFGRIFFSVRGGGRRLKGEAGIALLPSSPEVRWVSSKSSESSTTSLIHCLFRALGGDGAAEVDPSGTSLKLRPRYSPISG
jgi:hypothetical protein